MVKLKYILPHESGFKRKQSGVLTKVDGQVAAFNNAGLCCDLEGCSCDGLWNIISRLPFVSDGLNWDRIDVNGIDALYIRKPWITKQFITWLKEIREVNSRIIIILEVPTYPYDKENITNWRRVPLLLKDAMHRNQLKLYVDRIADLSGANKIFEIQTLSIYNGIDLDELPVRTPAMHHSEMHILCIAVFAVWHGIDRVLNGLAAYHVANKGRKIVLHLVGEGPSSNSLRRQCKRLALGDSVVFHGKMSSDEFAPIYDECDIAIECLANFRKDITLSSSLKSREYLAKGMPFIYSGIIDVFRDEPVDFCLQVPSDESPIDMQQVIDFRDRLYGKESPEELTQRIRAYAERHISMDAAMKPVIDYLKEECNG